MPVSSAALHAELADIAGRGHLLADGSALARYAVDGVVPGALIRPGGVEQVSRILAVCASEGLAVAPRGSGSSVALGNPPRRLDLVLDLSRLRSVPEYVPEDMVATVEAGAPLETLAAHLAPHRQMLALDPLDGAARSVGGVLVTHASGPLRLRYGTGRDLLLGVRFVQADGTVTWGGARVVKSVTGYDIPKLLVGSLGTLGVLVEATLRLHPLPAATASWRLGFASRDGAAAFLERLLDSTLQPDRALLVNGEALRRAAMTPDPAAVMVSISSVVEAVQSQGEALLRLAAAHGGRGETVADSVWRLLAPALRGPILLRLAAEARRLSYWVAELERAGAAAGAETTVVAQPGHGVLQASLWGITESAGAGDRLILPLRRGVESEGGSLVLERAPAWLKAQCEVWGHISSEALAIMSRIKAQFDPGGILNPGRFVGAL